MPLKLDQASTVKNMRSTGWQGLDDDRLAYAVCFVEEGYSHIRAAKRLGIDEDDAIRFQRDVLVQACIQDIQAQTQGISFLNEAWVDAKIAEIFPMVMGEVEVPFIDAKTGQQDYGKRFMPEIAVRLLDLKSPRKDLNIAFKGNKPKSLAEFYGEDPDGETQPAETGDTE
jgi:hypothetical protein